MVDPHATRPERIAEAQALVAEYRAHEDRMTGRADRSHLAWSARRVAPLLDALAAELVAVTERERAAVEALIAEMHGLSTVKRLAAMSDESYERLPWHAQRRVDRARLALAAHGDTPEPAADDTAEGER